MQYESRYSTSAIANIQVVFVEAALIIESYTDVLDKAPVWKGWPPGE